VESLHDLGEELDELGPPPDRRRACARCIWRDGGLCPCPVGSLTALLVRAVRAVDERREQRDLVRRRLGWQGCMERVPVAEMTRAYEEATGTCIGCD
jgi:hypothetical protein